MCVLFVIPCLSKLVLPEVGFMFVDFCVDVFVECWEEGIPCWLFLRVVLRSVMSV